MCCFTINVANYDTVWIANKFFILFMLLFCVGACVLFNFDQQQQAQKI